MDDASIIYGLWDRRTRSTTSMSMFYCWSDIFVCPCGIAWWSLWHNSGLPRWIVIWRDQSLSMCLRQAISSIRYVEWLKVDWSRWKQPESRLPAFPPARETFVACYIATYACFHRSHHSCKYLIDWMYGVFIESENRGIDNRSIYHRYESNIEYCMPHYYSIVVVHQRTCYALIESNISLWHSIQTANTSW